MAIRCWCRVRSAWRRLPRRSPSSRSLKAHSYCCSQVIQFWCICYNTFMELYIGAADCVRLLVRFCLQSRVNTMIVVSSPWLESLCLYHCFFPSGLNIWYHISLERACDLCSWDYFGFSATSAAYIYNLEPNIMCLFLYVNVLLKILVVFFGAYVYISLCVCVVVTSWQFKYLDTS